MPNVPITTSDYFFFLKKLSDFFPSFKLGLPYFYTANYGMHHNFWKKTYVHCVLFQNTVKNYIPVR